MLTPPMVHPTGGEVAVCGHRCSGGRAAPNALPLYNNGRYMSPFAAGDKMETRPSRRYVQVKFFGELPADIAVQAHLVIRNAKYNEVGPDGSGNYDGDYDMLSPNDLKKLQ